MPIYEYACQECRETFEELVVRKSDEDEVRCPRCGAGSVSRLLSRPAATPTGSASAGGRCGPVG